MKLFHTGLIQLLSLTACGLSLVSQAQAQVFNTANAAIEFAIAEFNCPSARDFRDQYVQCHTEGEESGEQRTADNCYTLIADESYGLVPEKPINAALVEDQSSATYMLREMVTAVDIPGLGGVVNGVLESSGLELAGLTATGQLEEPQTLGMTFQLPELGPLRGRVSYFATPKPDISPAVESALVAQGRSDEVVRKSEDLALGDDYLVQARLTLQNQYFGRDMSFHNENQRQLLNVSRCIDHYDAKTKVCDTDLILASIDAAVAAISHHQKAAWATSDTGLTALGCLSDVSARILRNEKENLRKSALPQFWKLVHNQPQIDLSYKRLSRDAYVGADASAIRLRFSTGLFNNAFFLSRSSSCKSGFESTSCAHRYNDMIEDWPFRTGFGLSAYYEQGDLLDIDIAGLGEASEPDPLIESIVSGLLPEDSASVQGSTTFSGVHIEGGRYQQFGWNLGLTLLDPRGASATSTRSVRLDLGAEYFRYKNQPARIDHDVLRAVVTIRSGEISYPIYLLYRTSSEFSAELPSNQELVVGVGTAWSWL